MLAEGTSNLEERDVQCLQSFRQAQNNPCNKAFKPQEGGPADTDSLAPTGKLAVVMLKKIGEPSAEEFDRLTGPLSPGLERDIFQSQSNGAAH